MRDWLRSLTNRLVNQEAVAKTQEVENLKKYGARSLDEFDLTEPVRQLNATERRGLATGAILSYWNDNPIKMLPRIKPEPLAERKRATAEWWGIHNQQDALETLRWLHQDGHRHGFRSQLKSQPLHWNERFAANAFLRTRTVAGVATWDYGRIVNVARWCYDYEYLSWAQAWKFIDAATRLAISEFDSWDSFATSFVAGRIVWNPELDSHAAIANIARHLVESPHSLWRDSPWQPYPVA